MKLIFSIILLVLALISCASIVAWVWWGIPFGLLLLCFSIWLFAEWLYKKLIPPQVFGWLFLLPALGLLLMMTANRNFGLVNLFLGNRILSPDQGPWWGILLAMFDAFVLPLLWWGAVLWIIIHFFRQVRKMV